MGPNPIEIRDDNGTGRIKIAFESLGRQPKFECGLYVSHRTIVSNFHGLRTNSIISRNMRTAAGRPLMRR